MPTSCGRGSTVGKRPLAQNTAFYRPAAVSALEQGIRGMIKAPGQIGDLTAEEVARQIASGHPNLPNQKAPDPEWIARRLQNGVHDAMQAAERMRGAGEPIPEFFERFLTGLTNALVQRGLDRLPVPSAKWAGRKTTANIEISPRPAVTPPADQHRTFIAHFYDRYLKPIEDRRNALAQGNDTTAKMDLAVR